MLRREKQPHQPCRLGGNRAERLDHGFGAGAEIGNIETVLNRRRSFLRRDPCAELVALGVGHAGLIAERHRLVDHGLGLDQRRVSLERSATFSSVTFLGGSVKLSCVGFAAWHVDAMLLRNRHDIGIADAAGRHSRARLAP